MEKVYGASGRTDGINKIGRNRWELIYGFGKDNDEDNSGYNWRQRFSHKPSRDEVTSVIKDTINRETDRRIVEGFSWHGMPVWLSAENQFNYKAAYDLAVQFNGATLPVRFKFGTDNAPVYHVFDTVADLADFYTSALRHISDTLAAGWAEKDSVDAMTFDTSD